MSDYHQYVTTLALQKLAAWAFATGERPRVTDPTTRRRPHRGMLPDVDFSRAVPVPRRPGLIARLFRLLTRRQRNAGAAGLRTADGATSDKALGEAERNAYVWVLDRESAASNPYAPVREKDRSRAA